ncbi:MAG: acyl-CoA dehydrogenase family protein 9 [Chlamydiales bacterium]|jgi:acyl-CoA dehydrogenase family protein 9
MDEDQKRLLEELLFSGEEKLSFAKMLYFGVFHSPSAFPHYKPNDEEQAFTDDYVKRLDSWATENIDADKIDREASIPDSVIQGLKDIKLLGITAPKEYGGLGRSQYSYCKAMENLASHCASTALFVNVHHSIGLRALVLFGTDEQKNKWLPSLTSGEKIAAFSLTEEKAGSDASGVETRAEYVPEKKAYRLNGMKQWTTNGSIADILTVMAQTTVDTPRGPEDKITAFLVTPDMPGFIVRNPALEKVGMRGTKTANLAFEDMLVPEENVLGPIGGGLRVCLTVLDYGRVTFGATCTGAGKYLVEKALEHASQRHQFKRPLASFPLVKKKLSLMSAMAYAMDATTYLTASLVDRGLEEFMLEAAILKVFNSDCVWTMLYDTMQIYGGRSFFTDQPFERMMRDARLNTIGEGSNEVLRAFIALIGIRDVGMQFKHVSEAFSHPISEFKHIKGFGRQCLNYVRNPDVPVQSDLLKEEAAKLGKCIRKFSVAVARLLSKYRENIVEKQLSLDRISTSVMAIYTTTAVLSKLDGRIQEKGLDPKVLKDELATGKFYCHYAFALIEEQLGSLFSNCDEEIESLSDQLSGVGIV